MHLEEAVLAPVDAARAYRIDDALIIQVAGQKPTPCHEVRIERSLLTVEPPTFAVGLWLDPRVRCVARVTDFDDAAAFRIGGAPPEVLIRHAGGELTLEVTELVTEGARLTADLPGTDPSEAVGYSSSWDLAEAFRDAIAHLPSGDHYPDQLHHYTIVDVGAEIGGIAGFNRMRVRVRGA